MVADHPELLDVNFADAVGPNKYKSDWMHCNGIDYNPILDQIALSCKNTNEIYIIDHSTTTEEAANHTGGNSGKGEIFSIAGGTQRLTAQGLLMTSNCLHSTIFSGFRRVDQGKVI